MVTLMVTLLGCRRFLRLFIDNWGPLERSLSLSRTPPDLSKAPFVPEGYSPHKKPRGAGNATNTSNKSKALAGGGSAVVKAIDWGSIVGRVTTHIHQKRLLGPYRCGIGFREG